MQRRSPERTQAHARNTRTQPMAVRWQPAPEFHMLLPPDEPQRLADLQSFRVLDTPPEEDLDNITTLAAHICGTPIALISLVDADRQWFKSKVGWDQSQSAREQALCAYTILQRDLLIVPDTTKDPRFANSPVVKLPPQIRFYAGAPLISPDHHVLGTLCVMDRVPRELTRDQTDALRALSRQVMAHLVLRRRMLELRQALLEQKRMEKQLEKGTQNARAATRLKDELLRQFGTQARTRLGVIAQAAHALDDKDLTPEQRRRLRQINAETKKLLETAREALNLSKLEVHRREHRGPPGTARDRRAG